jgi:hypothetical protein
MGTYAINQEANGYRQNNTITNANIPWATIYNGAGTDQVISANFTCAMGNYYSNISRGIVRFNGLATNPTEVVLSGDITWTTAAYAGSTQTVIFTDCHVAGGTISDYQTANYGVALTDPIYWNSGMSTLVVPLTAAGCAAIRLGTWIYIGFRQYEDYLNTPPSWFTGYPPAQAIQLYGRSAILNLYTGTGGPTSGSINYNNARLIMR